MDKITVKRDIWIDASRDRVWQAVTNPQQIGKWWPPDEWDIPRLRVGASVTFGKDNGAKATIAVVDPPREFTLQWQPNEKFPTAFMFTSLVLVEENGGTRLQITEGGFETLPEEIRQTRAAQSGEGYVLVLGNLKALLEKNS